MSTIFKPAFWTISVAKPNQLAPLGSTALVPSNPQPSLDELAENINRSHGEYEASLCKAADKAIATGRMLLQAKKQLREECGHGNWEDYVAEKYTFKLRTAQNYMQQARRQALQEAKRNQSPTGESARLAFLKRHQSVKIIKGIEERSSKEKR